MCLYVYVETIVRGTTILSFSSCFCWRRWHSRRWNDERFCICKRQRNYLLGLARICPLCEVVAIVSLYLIYVSGDTSARMPKSATSKNFVCSYGNVSKKDTINYQKNNLVMTLNFSVWNADPFIRLPWSHCYFVGLLKRWISDISLLTRAFYKMKLWIYSQRQQYQKEKNRAKS